MLYGGKMNRKKERIAANHRSHDIMESLNSWSSLVDVLKRVASTEIVEFENYIYFKVYYTDSFTTTDRNEVFVSISSFPPDENYTFLGVREYLENHEMCFVFKRK